MKQLKLFSEKVQLEHGGDLNLGKRKEVRPFYFGRPIHFILKADSDDVLLENKSVVVETIYEMCEKFVVTVFGIGVNWDHVHLHLQFCDRGTYNSWVRAVTGVLARRLGVKWKFVPYSRVETWGRDFNCVQKYVLKNEAEGNFRIEAMNVVKEEFEKFMMAADWRPM